jgi:hypothetical protein
MGGLAVEDCGRMSADLITNVNFMAIKFFGGNEVLS